MIAKNHLIDPSFVAASTSMPVLMVARELGGVGGIERDVSKFARHLKSHGIAPHVGCFNPGGLRWREIEAAGIPVVEIPVTSFKSLSVVRGFLELRRYVREHKIGIVHAFDIPADVFSLPAARLVGVPVTISSQLCYRELSPPLMRILLGAIDHLSTAIFVNCEAIADYLVDKWHVPRG